MYTLNFYIESEEIMSKRKKDFSELKFINPFDRKNFNKMVYSTWADRESFIKWRIENSRWLKSPELIEYLDVDEILSQWDVYPTKRKATPKTCNMIFKELAIVIRMIDAEHQDAIFSKDNKVPGVVKSRSINKWIYVRYDLDELNPKKATRIEAFDTEEEAYEHYKENRTNILQNESAKALTCGLIDQEVYDKYFSFSDTIYIRDYNYYKEEKYKELIK